MWISGTVPRPHSLWGQTVVFVSDPESCIRQVRTARCYTGSELWSISMVHRPWRPLWGYAHCNGWSLTSNRRSIMDKVRQDFPVNGLQVLAVKNTNAEHSTLSGLVGKWFQSHSLHCGIPCHFVSDTFKIDGFSALFGLCLRTASLLQDDMFPSTYSARNTRSTLHPHAQSLHSHRSLICTWTIVAPFLDMQTPSIMHYWKVNTALGITPFSFFKPDDYIWNALPRYGSLISSLVYPLFTSLLTKVRTYDLLSSVHLP